MSTKRGPLAVGDRFLKYTIRGLLGTGGHAWVYHGHDEFLDVEVAIKILHRPGGVTSDMLRRGQGEAKLLYRLKHENIVSVLDAGITNDGLLYIVMELLQGETLRRVLLKKGRLSVNDALALFAKVADGVEAAHSFGAIHRDLKPENIFVLADSEPKVLDFGIAKVVDAAGWTTEKDVIHGTVLYMAPEQLRGEKATAASDVYALGLMLFEVLHGHHPLLLKNKSPTIKELSWMQLSVKPPRLDELDSRVPRHVARLVERMMLKLPAHRPASMKECAQAIGACLTRLATDTPYADTPSPGEGRQETAPLVVTDRINDTEPVDGTPFDASVTLPRVPVAGRPSPVDAVRPAREVQAVGAGTVSPVTAAVTRTAPQRSDRGFDEGQRRRMLQVAVASCVVGAALGGVYVVLTSRPAALRNAGARSALAAAAVSRETAAGVHAPRTVTATGPSATKGPSATTALASGAATSATIQAPFDSAAPTAPPAARKPKRHSLPLTKSADPVATENDATSAEPKPTEQHHLADINVPILE